MGTNIQRTAKIIGRTAKISERSLRSLKETDSSEPKIIILDNDFKSGVPPKQVLSDDELKIELRTIRLP